MSILNEDSGSLIIAEGRNEIEINSSGENAPKEEDLFQLSRDDPTLSFQIEEQKKQQIFIEIVEPSQSSQVYSNIENQGQVENKKKRKEIFEKFKRPQTSIVSKLDSINTEDNLLHIFDSIFKTRVSQPEQNSERESKIDNNLLRPQAEIIARDKTPSSEKRQRVKIFGKKNYTRQYQQVLPSELIQSQASVVPAEPIGIGSPIMAKKASDSINFSLIENRLSGIYADQNLDYSRQQQQIKCILESQIFRDEQEKEKKETFKGMQNYSKVITSSDKIEIQKEQTIQHVIDAPPERKQIMLSAILPNRPAIQKSIPLNVIQMEESRVLRSETSIISNSPQLSIIHAYDGVGGFRPQNSMANINSMNIADLTMKVKDNNVIIDNANDKKISNLLGNRLYESQIIESRPPIYKVNNAFQSEKRMPIFLRQIRKHISIYPNFYAFNNPNTIQCIREEFNVLFDLFTKAIRVLSQLCQTVLDLKSKKNLYLSQLAKSMTVQFFLQSGWQKFLNPQQFEIIRPIEPFQSRQWSYQKAKTALKNYQNIVEYYKTKGIKLDIDQDKGKRKYFQIRQKFWDICGNMKLISQDIYSEMIDCHFPQHFHVFLQFLKSDFPKRLNSEAVDNLKQLRILFKVLKNENDLLVNSEIGVKIKQKLDLMTKYLIVY